MNTNDMEMLLSSELKAQSEGEEVYLPLYRALGVNGQYYEGHYAMDFDTGVVSLFWFEQLPDAEWKLVAQEVKSETIEKIKW